VVRKKVRILGIIPARGGSKGIKKKNISDLNGRPLISYTIEAAFESNVLSDIVVSTDDKEIAEISRTLGALVPFIRPKNLSDDKAESAPVVKHALLFMENLKEIRYDAILMLQPTSPLRTALHIKKSVELLRKNEFDSVVSVVSVNGYHPLRMKRIFKGRLENFIPQDSWNLKPRQDLPEVYIRNGAIYLIDRDVFLNNGELIGKSPAGFVMREEESVNIDSPIDLVLANILISNK